VRSSSGCAEAATGTGVLLHLKYTITRDDLTQCARLQTNFVQMAVMGGLVGVGVMFVLQLALDDLPNSAAAFRSVLVVSLLVGLSGGIGLSLILPIAQSYRIGQIHSQNPHLFGEMELTTDEQGIKFKSPTGGSQWRWSDFQGFKENGQMFVLCINKSADLAAPEKDIAPEAVRQFSDGPGAGFPVPKQGVSPELVQELRTHWSQNLKLLR
jgi:hypothetical protein